MARYRALALPLAALLGIAASGAQAKMLTFTADLNGTMVPTDTGSTATGKMRMRVDTSHKLVSVDLTVDGITVDSLSHNLVARPIGPVHFHKYGSHDHSKGDVVLVLPLPYGANYHPTAHGFHVTMKKYDYAAGAKLLGSDMTFDAFVSALQDGQVILNVHTERFGDGEISGSVGAVS